MNKYTIYCTEEQTKKALELGAPIITTSKEASMFFCAAHPKTFISKGVKNSNKEFTCAIPTADQMIGWLETQEQIAGIDLDIEGGNENNNFTFKWQYYIYNKYGDIVNEDYLHYPSRKEATLAAIDAALKYLTL